MVPSATSDVTCSPRHRTSDTTAIKNSLFGSPVVKIEPSTPRFVRVQPPNHHPLPVEPCVNRNTVCCKRGSLEVEVKVNPSLTTGRSSARALNRQEKRHCKVSHSHRQTVPQLPQLSEDLIQNLSIPISLITYSPTVA
ncbi:hypothetical protein EVAR_38840_1 [Eumeta japonica]|uniref:Uncharacterized protein n=1 Tax=Eumeta variegata TaxID=151549 RepID=A0A4C1XNV1_EUMVA|nr:hypothetical protein EVAR_38840_1 [Eumeta japonica]